MLVWQVPILCLHDLATVEGKINHMQDKDKDIFHDADTIPSGTVTPTQQIATLALERSMVHLVALSADLSSNKTVLPETASNRHETPDANVKEATTSSDKAKSESSSRECACAPDRRESASGSENSQISGEGKPAYARRGPFGWLRNASVNTTSRSFSLSLKSKDSLPASAALEDIRPESYCHKVLETGEPGIEFWTELLQSQNPRKCPDLGKNVQLGLPSYTRGVIWQVLCSSKNSELEAVYRDLAKERTCGYEKQIRKDLSRTFPKSLLKALTERNFVDETINQSIDFKSI